MEFERTAALLGRPIESDTLFLVMWEGRSVHGIRHSGVL